MCMEDVNIARACRTRVFIVDSSTLMIPPNPDRLAIRLMSRNAVQVKLIAVQFVCGTGGQADVCLASYTGYETSALGNAFSPSVWPDVRLEDVGEILKGPLQLDAANGQGIAIEVYLPVNDGLSLDISKLP